MQDWHGYPKNYFRNYWSQNYPIIVCDRNFAKAINKVTDEITFYYNPVSFQGMTTGSIMPSLSLLSKVEKLFTNVGKEATGYILDDEEMMKAAHPYKYFMNLVPIGAQLQTEVLPYIYPEFAKEIGIKVSSQSRGMRSR